MQIYLTIKFHADNRNRPLIEEISKHLEKQGHTVVCAVRDFEEWGAQSFEPRELLMKAFDAIDASDVVLIESTEKGMGVGIEAGYAFARGKPVITMAHTDSDISINLQSLSARVIRYSQVSEINL